MSDHDASGFGKFIPGFEFMQNLARQTAGGLVQEVQKSVPQLPNLSSWVAPTFNVEDLEKRIEELKAVHFWLEQNSRALGATIQALEVQKMTLATLQGMNFSMGDVANALKIKAVDSMTGMVGMAGLAPKGAVPNPAPSPAPAAAQPFPGLEVPPRRTPSPSAAPPAAEPPAAAPAAGQAHAPAGVVDPMQWWGALTQQFQAIATNALKDNPAHTAVAMGKQVASTLTQEAVKTATEMTAGLARNMVAPAAETPGRKPAQKGSAKSAPRKAASSSAQGVKKVATQAVKAVGKAAVKAAVTSKPAKKAPAKAASGRKAASAPPAIKAPSAKSSAKPAARSTAGRTR